jgi:hypothetical protein
MTKMKSLYGVDEVARPQACKEWAEGWCGMKRGGTGEDLALLELKKAFLAAVVILQGHGKVDLPLLAPRGLHHQKHARHGGGQKERRSRKRSKDTNTNNELKKKT